MSPLMESIFRIAGIDATKGKAMRLLNKKQLNEGIEDAYGELVGEIESALGTVADPAKKQEFTKQLRRLRSVFTQGYESDNDEESSIQMDGALGDMDALLQQIRNS